MGSEVPQPARPPPLALPDGQTVPWPGRQAAVRDVTDTRRRDLAAAVIAAEQASRSRELLDELLDAVVTSLFRVGLSLQVSKDLPTELTSQIIEEALGHLDDTVREIRDAAFTTSAAAPPE
jgi:hypothetical protein